MPLIRVEAYIVDPGQEAQKLTITMTRALGRFTDPKRLVMLLFFSLVAANSVFFLALETAKGRIAAVAAQKHTKIYLSYERAVERHKKNISVLQQGMQLQSALNSMNTGAQQVAAKSKPSPWWLAVEDIRKEFPSNKIDVVVAKSTNTNTEEALLNKIKNKPRGYSVSDELDGWSKTYFILPTKNTATLSVQSYVKDDINEWGVFSTRIALWTFGVFLSFGWFWTRALDDGSENKERIKRELHEQVADKIQAMQHITKTMEPLIQDLSKGFEALKSKTNSHYDTTLQSLEETVNHIHLLAINGSLEALRTQESQRLFYALLQEINERSLKTKRLVGTLNHSDVEALNHLTSKLEDLEKVLKRAS